MKGVISESRMVPKSQNKTPVKLQIPVGQWNGNGPYTYTVNVTNVTANTDIDYTIDESQDYLTSEIVVATGAGTVTLTTASLPTGTVNVTVYFRGVTGEINVQVLADVYSKSQVDTLLGAKVNTLDVVDNLTTTVAGKVLDARQGKALSDAIAQSTATIEGTSSITWTEYSDSSNRIVNLYRNGRIVYFRIGSLRQTSNSWVTVCNLPSGYRPALSVYTTLLQNNAQKICGVYIGPDGNVVLFGHDVSAPVLGTVVFVAA